MPLAEPFTATNGPQVAGPAPSGFAWLRARLMGISTQEARFECRGFAPAEPARQQRLELIGRCFIAGYNASIRSADPTLFVTNGLAPTGELAGFAFEGAAMAFALLDLLSPWPSHRFARFLSGPASRHVYMSYVGAGWALARTSPYLARRLGPLDPLLRWLMFDGYGFHAGCFRPRDAIGRQHCPAALRGREPNAFDQGLGRAVWFVKGADIRAVAATVSHFPPTRRADLWSGIGLAAAYAGGVDADELRALIAEAGPYQTRVGQGAAFAAKARSRAGNPAPHTELACQVFCGMDATQAAAITDRTLPPRCGPNDRGEAYQAWRDDISRHIGATTSEEANP